MKEASSALSGDAASKWDWAPRRWREPVGKATGGVRDLALQPVPPTACMAWAHHITSPALPSQPAFISVPQGRGCMCSCRRCKGSHEHRARCLSACRLGKRMMCCNILGVLSEPKVYHKALWLPQQSLLISLKYSKLCLSAREVAGWRIKALTQENIVHELLSNHQLLRSSGLHATPEHFISFLQLLQACASFCSI